MKLVALSLAAATLAAACASTAPQQHAATDMAACSARLGGGAAGIEATAHCSSPPSLTPDALHARVSAEARTRQSLSRN